MSAPGQDTPAEGAPTTSPAPSTSSAPDWAPVQDRVDQLANDFGGFREMIEQRLPAPAQQAEPDPWANLFGTEPDGNENLVDVYGQPTAPAAQQLDPQALQTAIQTAIQQSNAPLVQRLQQFELQQAQARLYEQVPQLKPVPEGHADYAANQAARQQVSQLVQQAIAPYPPEIAQALQNDPNFIATQWKAAEADRLAQGQAPAGGPAPTLEAAGGALPGGQSAPANPVDQAYGGRQGLPAAWS